MKTKTGKSRTYSILKTVLITGMLAAVLGMAAPTADAHRKHRKHHRHDGRDHHVYRHEVIRHAPARRHYQHHRRHARFDVPRRMPRLHHVTYEPYYHGRVYYEPHGHYHRVYRFPVYTEYGIVYRPHAYCGARFHASGRFTVSGPVFRVHVDF